MTRGWILVALLAGVVAAFAAPSRVTGKMPDFQVYWIAAWRAAHAEPLYRTSDEHYQFKYLPAFAMGMRPVGGLRLTVAKRLWFGASVGLLIALIAMSVSLLPPPLLVPRWLVAAAAMAALAKFYAHELVLGQTNLLFGVLALVGLAALRRRADVTAGIAFGASAVIKPYGAILLPYLLVTRRTNAALSGAIVLLAALAVPVMSYGWRGNVGLLRDWWTTVVASTEPNLANQDNVSIAGLYAKWLGAGVIAGWLTLATTVVFLAALFAALGRRTSGMVAEYFDLALLLTAIPLLSPQGWDYVLLLSTPAVMLLVNNIPRMDRASQIATVASLGVIGLALYDVMGRAAYARFMAMSGITICYACIVFVLVSLRVKRLV